LATQAARFPEIRTPLSGMVVPMAAGAAEEAPLLSD
jgi:hypothetical protein